MLLGRVIGTVVSTNKEQELSGLKLLLVRGADVEGKPTGPLVVAIDAVGAGLGEVVLYASGSSARQTRVTKDRPVDDGHPVHGPFLGVLPEHAVDVGQASSHTLDQLHRVLGYRPTGRAPLLENR